MIVLNVTYRCRPGMRDEFLRNIVEEGIDTASRADDGNIRYDYFIPADGSDDLLLIEKWRDRDAFTAHGRQPQYARLAKLKEAFVTETLIEIYEKQD